MKEKYPKYKQGELDIVKQNLIQKDKEVLEKFLEKCSTKAGEGKVKKIGRLLVQVADITEIPLTQQTKDTINYFLVLLNHSDRSVWTKNELKVYLKQFLLWYYKNYEMVENIKSDNRRGLNPQKITENNLIDEKDVEKMLRYAQNYKEKAYLLLLFQTGARPQELALLRWKDVLFEDNYADITLFSNKTKRSRTFPVVEKTKDCLFEWKQHYPFVDVTKNDYVFVSRWRNKPMTSVGLNKILRRMAKSSGLNKDVWNYLFRHSKATQLYEELPTPIVEKLMGHSNMSHIYAHISNKKAREVMLNKIYKVEKVSANDKTKIKNMEKEIAELRAVGDIVQKMFAVRFAKGMSNFKLKDITDEQIVELAEDLDHNQSIQSDKRLTSDDKTKI